MTRTALSVLALVLTVTTPAAHAGTILILDANVRPSQTGWQQRIDSSNIFLPDGTQNPFDHANADSAAFTLADTPGTAADDNLATDPGGETIAHATPEPSTLLLLGTGMVLAAFFSFKPIHTMNLPTPPGDTHR